MAVPAAVEWKVWAIPPDRIRHTHVPTLAGELPQLPGTVTQYYADGSTTEAPVTWEPVSEERVQDGGTRLNIIGLVEGTSLIAEATVYVRETNAVSITFIEEEQVTTIAGVPPALPDTVTATFNDGSRDNVNTRVTWEAVDPSQYAQPGTFTVSGTVEGTSLAATATVTVRP